MKEKDVRSRSGTSMKVKEDEGGGSRSRRKVKAGNKKEANSGEYSHKIIKNAF
jgi:hypothetical protein